LRGGDLASFEHGGGVDLAALDGDLSLT